MISRSLSCLYLCVIKKVYLHRRLRREKSVRGLRLRVGLTNKETPCERFTYNARRQKRFKKIKIKIMNVINVDEQRRRP